MEIRENTYDDYILKEINKTYGWMNVKDKVVMDIGGCFGAASVFFVEHGAKEVVVYEPEPDNFRLLTANTSGLPVKKVNAAVTLDSKGTSFFVNENGINKGTHTLRPTRGRKEIHVNTVDFWAELENYRPEVLKIDCEGGEYIFMNKPLPDYVKQVCIEVHRTNEEYRQKAFGLVELFNGWECVRFPKLEGGHWATIGSWRRA
jgi:FkbM family methyltransferase